MLNPCLLCSLAALSFIFSAADTSLAADRTEVATTILGLGGSMGKLVWTQLEYDRARSQVGGDRYQAVALEVKNQIEVGRAASDTVKLTLGVVGTTVAYAGMMDPEPLSKGIAAVVAWGAKKTGDAMGQMVLDQYQERAQSILAGLFQNNGFTPDDLKSLSPTELQNKIADLKVGGLTMRDILRDDPPSLEMLQDNAVDVATNIGVEAFGRAAQAQQDVDILKHDVVQMKEVESYQDQVGAHLDDLTTKLSNLQSASQLAAQSLSQLNTEVGRNSLAIRTLSQVSYSGWTTAQKLQAVQGGLFTDLSPPEKSALVKTLEAAQAQEKLVSEVQLAAQDLGNLAAIARNVGLPPARAA